MPLERVDRTKLSVTELKVGAVEIEDATSGARANVGADGADLGLNVRSNTLSAQATQALVQAAVEIIDNCIGIVATEFTGDPAVIGGVATEGVPTEVADGFTVQPWWDRFGRLVDLATDLAQQAKSVSDIAPAQMQVLVETGWVALTAPGQFTPVINVQDYENITIAYIIAFGACTDIDYIVWGSIDGTNWFKLAEDNVTTAEDNPDAVIVSCVAVKYLKCEFEGEAGDTDAIVTFQAMAGN